MEIKENTVYNCDCIEMMREMARGGVLVDCIITDPPYLINYKSNYRKNKDHRFCKTILNDDNEKLIEDYIRLCNDILKENSAMYMFCSPDTVDFFLTQIKKYFKVKNIIIWVKNGWSCGDVYAQYSKQYEMIIYVNKGRKKFTTGKRKSDVWFEDRVAGNNQIHQNEKPVNLICEMINNSTDENDLVFDGFMGSFTTAVACHKTGRKYLGCELDQEYFKLGSERLNSVKNQISMFD